MYQVGGFAIQSQILISLINVNPLLLNSNTFICLFSPIKTLIANEAVFLTTSRDQEMPGIDLTKGK
jgi:hypothetical protein